MTSSLNKLGTPLIRLGHPIAFTTYLNYIGATTDRYLRREKLPVICDDPDMFVPLERVWSFFATAARNEDPMLGWRVGAYVGDHNLNASLLCKLETASTLYQALKQFVQLARSEASHIQLGIYERRTDVLLYTHYLGMREVPGYMTSQGYQLQVMLGLIRHLLKLQWVPDEIGLEHSITTSAAKELLPGTRIRIQQPVGYIAVPRTLLSQAVHFDAMKRDVAKNLVLYEALDFIDTLRVILKAYLPDGYPSAQLAAALMNVSERTLARRLSSYGMTYGTLIDEVRFIEAKKFLAQPGMRIGDVAVSVGFNDQRNFTRMFRRVSGLSPKEYLKTTRYRVNF